jgi:molecular chaperone IbpA
MVTQFAMDLFKDPFFIGFNRELERINNVYREATNQSYPPYDVLKTGEDSYEISLAVAGFSKEELSVNIDNGSLVVQGLKESVVAPKPYLHKGIAARKFIRTFALSEYMEVQSAELVDGILKINIERIVPEEKKPKAIKIK